jgi:hypothetical protein
MSDLAAKSNYLYRDTDRHQRLSRSGAFEPNPLWEGHWRIIFHNLRTHVMDATRARRTRDQARQKWYARCRQVRFARFLGFPTGTEATNDVMENRGINRVAVRMLS